MAGKKKSQAWSFDVILAVIIFVGAFFVFYALTKPQVEKSADTLRSDAELIAKELLSESSPLNILDGSTIDEAKLQQLLSEDYPALKSQVRVEGNFCIYLEDQDGNVIYISREPDVTGVGSPTMSISSIPCQ